MEGVKITSTFNAIPENLPSKKPTLNDYSWEEIKRISDLQLWNLYGFKDGDKKTVNITGSASGVDLTGSWDCFILGFNHNESLEGTGITFQFAKKDNKDIAFQSFKMNKEATNSGGWKSSIMRTETCTQFFNLLPKDLKSVIKETIKFTDNVGGGGGQLSENISATTEKIFILSCMEVAGGVENIPFYNRTENNFQKQYSYFRNGNSRLKYNFKSLNQPVGWWLRSPRAIDGRDFYSVRNDGVVAEAYSAGTYAFAPCFVI